MTRILAWLATNAPRTRAALEDPVPPQELAAFAREFHCDAPAGFAALYGTCGGQTQAAPAGIFRGQMFMPLRGVDGVETAWEQMMDAAQAGAPWATKDRYPFAKDFSGNFLCVDMDKAGRVIAIEEGETRELAADMESFLEKIARELNEGILRIEDGTAVSETTIEAKAETFTVVFDAARERTPGSPVTHAVFAELGIDAVVESIADYASPFDKRPFTHGFYVRMRSSDPRVGLGDVTHAKLVDDRGRPVRAEHGQGSGGGKPGFFVYVRSSTGPLPAGSRLTIELVRRPP